MSGGSERESVTTVWLRACVDFLLFRFSTRVPGVGREEKDGRLALLTSTEHLPIHRSSSILFCGCA
jgi:hypothetical protein